MTTYDVPAAVWLGLASIAAILLLGLLRGKLGRELKDGLERVQDSCKRLAYKGLHPEELTHWGREAPVEDEDTEDTKEHTGSEVVMILTRLLGLMLAINVLLAVYILDAVRVPLIVFEGQAASGLVHLPVSIPTVLGILTWSMTALQGAFLFEVLGVVPPSAEFLMPWWRKSQGTRVFFRVAIGATNLWLLGYDGLLGLMSSFELEHISWRVGAISVNMSQMVLANITAMASLWLLVVGMGALFALMCLIVRLLCATLHLMLRAWVTEPKIAKAIEPPPLASETIWPEGKGDWDTLINGHPGSALDLPIKDRKVKPAPYQTSIVMAGTMGWRMLPELLDDVHELDGGKGSIRVAGLVPTKRMPERFHKEAISRVGAKSISSTPLQVKIARQYKGSEVTQLLNQVRLKLQEHTPEAAAHELTLFGMDAGVLPQAVEPMRLLSRAKPRQVLVPMVELPMTQPGSASQQDTLHLVVTLHEEKAVATTLLFDPKGPLAQHVGQEKARTLLIRSLNGLLVAEKHLLANPTGAEMLATLRVFPCVSLAIGTNALPPGPRLSRFDPGRRTDGAPVGRGDVEQTRESLALLASKLLRDETAWLTALPLIPKRRPLVGEVFIPFEKNDYRFQTICAGLERWVGETVPGADLVFIAGPGVSEDAVDARYFGQWSWFYGLTREELLGTPPSQQENTHPKESSLPIVPLVPRGRGRPRRTPLPDTAEKQLANRRQRTPLRLV